MNQLITKALWVKVSDPQLAELGISVKEETEYKDVVVNKDRIAFLENYNGKICVNFSGFDGDVLITDLSFNLTNIERFKK